MFTGQMRDLMIWDAALTTEQLSDIRLSGQLPASPQPVVEMMRGVGGVLFSAAFYSSSGSIEQLSISGNLGCDGSGSVTGNTVELSAASGNYRGWYKSVVCNGDPSVNHLIIAPTDGSHSWSTDTNQDNDAVAFSASKGVGHMGAVPSGPLCRCHHFSPNA